jgi:peptide/nickel transport system substrate-binding protein
MDPRNDTFEREGYDRVASIDAPDTATVVVHLRERYPPFVSRFFAPLQEGGKPILPAHILQRERDFNNGDLAARPIGTGPFEFVSWSRADRILLRRFDGYFKGRPRLDRIELRFIPNTQTIAAELEAHHVDLIVAPQTSLLDQYRAVPGVVVTTAPSNAQGTMILNDSKPGIADVVVRRAMAAAVPYRTIIADVTRGIDEPSHNSSPPTALGYQALPARRLNVAEANRMLDAAGWRRGADGVRSKGGVRLDFDFATIAGITNFERMALLIQSSLRSVGIGITVKPFPYRTIFAPNGPIYGGSYDIALYSDTLNWDPDIYNFIGCDRFYPRGQNIFRFCDPKVDALELAGLATDDPAARASIYRAAGVRMWSDVSYIPIYNARRLIVRSADLQDYSVNPTSTPWWNAWQWDI